MFTRQKIRWLLLGLLVAAMLLVGCGQTAPGRPPTRTPPTRDPGTVTAVPDEPTPEPPEPPDCQPLEELVLDVRGDQISEGGFWPQQVVMTGFAGDIAATIETIGLSNLLRLVVELPAPEGYDTLSGELSDLDSLLNWQTALYDFDNPAAVAGQLALYESGFGMDLSSLPLEWRIIWATYNEALQSGQQALAAPNYLTGDPITGPGSVGGDPITGPGSVGGDGSSNPVSLAEAKGLFATQWALGPVIEGGINLDGAVYDQTGAGVEVAIFDTSPLSNPDLLLVDWADRPFYVCVSHPVSVPDEDPSAVNVQDHGLFAASMAHAVAPDADYHIYRVLNNTNQGDLSMLVTALARYRQDRLSRNGGVLTDTVINLSLGVDPRALDPTLVPDEMIDMMSELRDSGNPDFAYLLNVDLNVTVPIPPLQLVLAQLRQLGAVNVAAAGNDSSAALVQPIQAPASYEDVIGVTASNYNRGRSCFANAGEMAAPGGDGLNEAGVCNPNAALTGCMQAAFVPGGAGCNDALLGQVMTANAPPNGHAFWLGTSFSSPLVSGAAALVAQALTNDSLTPVRETLLCGARLSTDPGDPNLGEGILNVAISMSEECLQP